MASLPPAPSTPPPASRSKVQSEYSNLLDLEDSIDIFRTDNDIEKVVRRGVCYFGTTTAGISSYIKEDNLPTVHRWTLPLNQVKLFDLTAPDNNVIVKDIKGQFNNIKNILIIIDDINKTFSEEDIFNECLKINNGGQFVRHSDNVDIDNKFFELLKDKLNDYFNLPPNSEYHGTYTKIQDSGHSHAEVVIWDEETLTEIHKQRYSHSPVTMQDPNFGKPQKRQRGERGPDEEEGYGEETAQKKRPPPPNFGGGGKRKTQKKTKKKRKTSNKKSKRKNTTSLHKKKGGSYKKKTKKQRRNKKKVSLKHKRK